MAFALAGQGVLVSARGPGANGVLVPGQPQPASPGTSAEALPQRRRDAVKKAFKHLDPMGTGFAALDDVKQALASSPLQQSQQQKVMAEMERSAQRRPDGRSVLPFSVFVSYYAATSRTFPQDSDFEQMLHSTWGLADVSDVLSSMQRQFALIGFNQVFQDCAPPVGSGEVSAAQFETALRRAGLTPRRDDVQRLVRAFGASVVSGPRPGAASGGGGGILLDGLKDQLLAPRPETPCPLDAGPSLFADSAAAPQPVAGRDLPNFAATPPRTSPGAVPMSPGIGGPWAAASSSSASPPIGCLSGSGVSGGAPPPTQLPFAPPSPGGAGGSGSSPSAPRAPTSHAHAHHAKQPLPDGPVSDEDLDSMLSKMEGHLSRLKAAKAAADGQGAPGGGGGGPGGGGGKPGGAGTSNLPEGPLTEADLDAALTHLEGHIGKLKAHKHDPNAKPHWGNSTPAADPPDMPHWEHHKYGHHEIKESAWKPQASVTDSIGHQHQSAEYGYNVYGGGSHGHHLSHYHLNDYQGLAHHDFKKEEYETQQFGDKAHHGHWVPHLHGMGTQAHQGEHAYEKEEYSNQSYGKAGHHSHWVPHLHGMGQAPPQAHG